MKRLLWLLTLLPVLAFGGAAGPYGIFGGPIPSTTLPPATSQAGSANTYAFTSDQGLLVSSGASWGPISAGSVSWATLVGGTNTTAAFVMGPGSSLTSSGGTIDAVTLQGANFATPLAIGSGTPNLGIFAPLTVANGSTFTLANITGSTQCLHVNTSGLVSGTGSDCASGAGTVNNGTSGDLAYYASTGTAVSQLPIGTGLAINTGTLVPVQVINAQTGTSYTVLSSDAAKLVTFNNGSAVAVTLPQATGSFGTGYAIDVENLGAGAVTITPNTSTINGASTLVLAQNQGCSVSSDGTNWQVSACTAALGLGTFATQNYATPPAIGGTTPAAGSFTTLSATGNLTTNVTGGGTQCLHVSNSGVVSGTAADCGSGSGGAGTFVSFAASSVAQATTDYICGSGLVGTLAAQCGGLSTLAWTLKGLYVHTVNAPAAGQTFTFTLYNGAPGSEGASSITCQISNPNTSCNDTTHTVTTAAGDHWDLQAVTSSTSGATGVILVGIGHT